MREAGVRLIDRMDRRGLNGMCKRCLRLSRLDRAAVLALGLAAAALTACAGGPAIAPDVHVVIDPSISSEDAHLVLEGVIPWLDLGFTLDERGVLPECPRAWRVGADPDCTLTITAEQRDGIGSARADRRAHLVSFDVNLEALDLWRTANHEIGHVLADCDHLPDGEHGIMSWNTDRTTLTAGDRALACASVGLGCE
jgi:hypothetical protein